MIDSIDALSFSMHSAKGVYALLLGSGVSRSAAIPTGWEIVLDLVRRIATVKGEDCEPDPAAWYQNKFGKEPDYSELLEELTKGSASIRQQVLEEYLEPTQVQREQGQRVPTEAHKAIASLVASGHIQVILTTNFDRLLEKALDAVGINPTVISSAAEVAGMAPISRVKCLVVKLHGDYLDTRIKNTKAELNSYEDSMNQLLDRVFDEYGLIICGWSADWDIALKEALQRCKSRRYTTYWATRGKLTHSAEHLAHLRAAQIVQIDGADQFFQQLADKVHALEEFSKPHPLSAEIAVSTLKKHLSDDKVILANDLMMQAASDLHERLSGEEFSVSTPCDTEIFNKRVQQYEALVNITQALMITGCYWGNLDYRRIWTRCLQRVADPEINQAGNTNWINLKRYPGLLLLYSGGIAAFAAERLDNLAALVSTEVYDIYFGQELPSVMAFDGYKVFEHTAQNLTGVERTLMPVSSHLFRVLREPLRSILLQDRQYQKCFDQFEYLMALIYADQGDKTLITRRGTFWAHSGLFSVRNADSYYIQNHKHPIIGQEIPTKIIEPLLKAGLFDSTTERFEDVKKGTDESLLKNWTDRVIMGR